MVWVANIFDVISEDKVEVHFISPWIILKKEEDYRLLLKNKNDWNDIFIWKKELPEWYKKEQYWPNLITTRAEVFKWINAWNIDEHKLCADFHIVIENGKVSEYLRWEHVFEFVI